MSHDRSARRTLLAACVLTTASLATAPLAATTRGEDGPGFLWRGTRATLEEPPVALSPEARTALDAWAPWADAHGYLASLSDDQRVLFLLEGRSVPRRTARLLSEALRTYDTLVPQPRTYLAAERDAGAPPDPDPGRESGTARPGPPATAVLAQVTDQEDYESFLDHAVELEPYLASWAPSGKRAAGLVLERPLVAAWLKNPSGVDEWDPANELVHRLGELLTLREYGQLPHWLQRGLAWTLEIEVRGDVACFPDRSEFVFSVEHGSWPRSLQRVARHRDGGVSLDDLAAWQRGKWDADRAILAWGVARWLTSERSEALPGLLRALSDARVEGSIERFPDGTWKTRPGFTLDADAQRAIFARLLGDDFEADWTRALSGEKKRAGSGRGR